MVSANWTIQDYAKHYVEIINSPANAWGQHNSVFFGQSHNVLDAMYHTFGAELSIEAIKQAEKRNA